MAQQTPKPLKSPSSLHSCGFFRPLSDRILLICTGEMGRTPRLNHNGGCDHWAKLAPLMLYGGGVPEGKVIGQSTRDGGKRATENFTSENLISTVLHAVCNPPEVRLLAGLNAIGRLAETPPIGGLF